MKILVQIYCHRYYNTLLFFDVMKLWGELPCAGLRACARDRVLQSWPHTEVHENQCKQTKAWLETLYKKPCLCHGHTVRVRGTCHGTHGGGWRASSASITLPYSYPIGVFPSSKTRGPKGLQLTTWHGLQCMGQPNPTWDNP